MRTQYGLSLYGEEFKQMSWAEFSALLSGLSAETPLGRIIQIRLETDPEVYNEFTPSQKQIRNEWQKKQAMAMPQNEVNAFLESLEQVFKNMAGVGGAANGC